MIESLYIAATGMAAQQRFIDVTANNLVNLNTPAFKKTRVSFQDLYYRGMERSNGLSGSDSASFAGTGSAALLLGKVSSQGQLKKTDIPTDLAINGEGYIEVMLADGSSAYVRSPSLQVNRDGLLATSDGHVLHQQIAIPTDASSMQIDATGKVSVRVPNENAPVDIGQIELVRFMNPAGLKPLGDSLYEAVEGAGEPIHGKAGEDNFGTLQQGYAEASNVQLNEEIIGLTLGQRAYEANAKVVQVSDEMLGIINSLRR
jgi:flagellar basal-body rod protein FlgG